MRKIVFITLLLSVLLVDAVAREPIKTVIITGQNNHNWRVSHLAIRDILQNSGLFSVDLAVSPAQGADMSAFDVNFDAYELVVLDYTGDRWSAKMDQDFLKFVRRGGGVVVYHAANNAFPEWTEFNRVIALGGWGGRNENAGPYAYIKDGVLIKDNSKGNGGSHGAQHEFILECFDPKHPVVRGLPTRWMHAKDELYDRMRGPANIKSVLWSAYSDESKGGSSRQEPLLITVDNGKARIFHTMLGHAGESLSNNPAMQCTGFQVTLLRGAEWAARGKITQKVPTDFPTVQQITSRPAYK